MLHKIAKRAAVALIALAAPAAFTVASATAAHASGESLTLTSQPDGDWVASGSGYQWSQPNVSLWVMDVTNNGWSVLESQSNLATTSSSCSKLFCLLGGRLSAKGVEVFHPASGLFAAYTAPAHPLLCSHVYQPVSYNAADGWVYGSTYNAPACPVIH